jgi:methionyl-tRNA formyltransferase
MQRLRLAFLGSADFSVPALAALIDAGHDVAAVYTQPPRPAGRGQQPQKSPVHRFAEAHGLGVRTPASLKPPAEHAAFAALRLDAAVVAAYGLILPAAVLALPRLGCFNVHASLLPRWRGAAPIQRAILAGDGETGVTIMLMDEGLDTGPILGTARVPIAGTTTAADLHDGLAGLGARLMVETLELAAVNRLTVQPQPEAGATYARKLERTEGNIDWTRPAAEIDRMVRALNPWPGVRFRCRGEQIRVLAARVVAAAGVAGTVLDARLTVACGVGALQPLSLQRAGRSACDVAAFLRGFPIAAGTSLAA